VGGGKHSRCGFNFTSRMLMCNGHMSMWNMPAKLKENISCTFF